MLVLGNETEALVVGVEQHELAGLRVERDLVGNSSIIEELRPDDRRLRRQARLEQRLELLAVLGARRSGRESSLVGEVRRADGVAQRPPVLLGDSCELKPAVDRPVEAVQRADPALVRVEARSWRGDAVDEERVGRQHGGAVEQRRPQLLAFARSPLVVERGEAADDGEHCVGRVGHAEAQIQRHVSFAHRAGFVLETRRRLVQRVEASEACERPFESVGPCVAVHDVGIDGFAVFVRDPESLGNACGHVVVDDVGPFDELERDLVAALGLEIEGDVALAALAARERLIDEPHAVAVHRLDLDHVGAEVAHHHGTERAREILAEVDDRDSFERMHHAAPLIVVISAAE